GSFNVKELFGELRVPLVEGQPFAHQLTLDLGYRYSDYSTAGSTDTFKVGGDWSPVEDIRFRAGFNRAVRAPNVVELFASQAIGLFNMNADPCSGPTPALTLEQCLRTGLTAAQYGTDLNNSAGQYNAIFGGNPDLDPEKADTISLGAVITPAAIDGLSVAVDYFNIKVEEQIGIIPSALAISRCGTTGNALFCDLINRGTGGLLWVNDGFVTSTNLNTGTAKTSGVDVEVNYSFDLAQAGADNAGSLAFSLVGTWLDKLVTEPIKGEGSYDCVGLHGVNCLVPSPEWRHKLRTTWTSPWSLGLSVSWRYVDGVKVDLTSPNPLLTGAFTEAAEKMGSRNYFDVAGTWDAYPGISLSFGVNNVFDRDPPVTDSTVLAATFGNGNTYPQVYDALGRYVFIGARAEF
ncbi:MAG TPA: TonB-dependent receptor, partial [Azospirillaceae bacterium]|nr:TonB-dependent receptor [Azospirillaceae bacterium]